MPHQGFNLRTQNLLYYAEFDAWPEVSPSSKTFHKENDVNTTNSCDEEEPMDVDMLSELVDQEIMEEAIQIEATKENTQNDNSNSVKKTKKRKSQRKLKFTHKKRCTRPPATCKFCLLVYSTRRSW